MLPYFFVAAFLSLVQQAQTPTLHLSAQLVLLDASVEDSRTGQLIPNLTPDDFLLTENETPQPVSYLSEDRLPLSIVMLFDTTDTVRPVLKALAGGAHEVVAHLRAEDEVAVYTFSSTTVCIQPFTTDHALLEAAILKSSTIHSGEATFIHEDLFQATQHALDATIPTSRRVEVWLTDGTTNSESAFTHKYMGRSAPEHLHTKEEVDELLLRSNVAVSALIERSSLTYLMAPEQVFSVRPSAVQHSADLTGGPVLSTSKKEVALRLAQLLDLLRQRYTLGFRPDIQRPPGTLCKLHLSLSPAFYAAHPERNPKSVKIRARQSYLR